MATAPLHVYLWSLPAPAIIVPAPTSVTYCNQVNGVACEQRKLEGFLLPMPRVVAKVFDPRWWEKHFNRRVHGYDKDRWRHIAVEIEAALAAIMSSGELAHHVRVIEDDDNVEAWVRVEFDFNPDDGAAALHLEGILTWENCD